MSSPSLVATIADTSARAVFTVFCVLFVGVAMAYAGKVDRKGLSVISTTLNYLFVPALLFNSMAQGLSLEALNFAWSLTIVGILVIPITAAIAFPILLLDRPVQWFRPWFIFGLTFQNTVALPLVFVATICDQIQFSKRTPSGDLILANGTSTTTPPTYTLFTPTECRVRGELYIFLYIFVNSLIFWVVAFEVMPSTAGSTVTDVNSITDNTSISSNGHTTANNNNTNSNSSTKKQTDDSNSNNNNNLILHHQSTSKQNLLDQQQQQHIDDVELHSTTILAATTTPSIGGGELSNNLATTNNNNTNNIRPTLLTTLSQAAEGDLVAGSFYGTTAAVERERFIRNKEERVWNSYISHVINKYLPAPVRKVLYRIQTIILRPPIIAQLLGMFVGLIEPLQTALYSNQSVLRPVTNAIEVFSAGGVAMTNLSMAAGLGIKMKEMNRKYLCGGAPDGISRRTTLVFIVARMIIIPAVLFLITWAVMPILPQDRLLILVVFLMDCTPSANMIVVVPQILNYHKASDELSLLVLGQYLLALPTMLLFLSLALYLTSHLQ
jgi:predicted permease